LWQSISGPAPVVIASPSSPSTEAVLLEPGVYQLMLSGTNSLGTTERSLTVEAIAPDPAIFTDWQQLTWPGVSDPEIIAPDTDPDHDGLVNLLEWALHLDGTSADVFHPELVTAGATLEFTYTRRKISPGGASFQVEWSDNLGGSGCTRFSG
jgi:hypothetical protein